jgi:hypothetical protein
MLDFNGLELRSEKIANIQKTTRASMSLGCTIENITLDFPRPIKL